MQKRRAGPPSRFVLGFFFDVSQVFWTHRWPSPRRRSSRHHRARPGRSVVEDSRRSSTASRASLPRKRTCGCAEPTAARSTAELKRLATAARMRCARRADASRRDQQARDQRRRQRAQHDRRAAPAVAKTVRPERVAAAAAALQPEPDDVKIIFGSQARIPPGAAHPRHTHPTLHIPGHDALQQPSEPQWCLRELTRCAALVLRAPRPRSFVSTTTPCSVRGEKR